MVRAGVVNHPAKRAHNEFERQKKKTRLQSGFVSNLVDHF
jgi:hypothetical protein